METFNREKTVFITGSTKGIGHFFYKHLRDHRVITHGRSAGGSPWHIACNLCDINCIEQIFSKISHLGKIDMFIHNCYIDDISISKKLIDGMASYIKKEGKIILISSGLAANFRHGDDFTNQYTLVKAGLEKYMKILADKYYCREMCFTTLQIDRTYDTVMTKGLDTEKNDMNELGTCIDFFLEKPWDELTGRCFISSAIISRTPGYGLELNYQHLGENSLKGRIFLGNRVLLNQNRVKNENLSDTDLSSYGSGSFRLCKKLAEIHKVSAENIELHDGTLNFLEIMINVMVKHGHDILCFDPSWNIIKDIAHERNVITDFIRVSGHKLIPDYDRMLERIGSLTRLIYLVAPLNRLSLVLFLTRIPGNIPVIIDFCYNEFFPSDENIGMNDFADSPMPVISISTFSKFYGMPGLKLSYSVSNREIKALISKFFHKPVDKRRETAALTLLSDLEYQDRVRCFYKEEMRKYTGFLEKLDTDYAVNTPMSLLIFNTDKNIPSGLSDYIIADSNGWLITIQDSKTNDKIIKELQKYLSKYPK